ncbi:MAG TPA: dihydropteroate synthase [Propionibacteriaceae bacterium]|nr:dihydropteroate synthase [Propionibacteriaceae bacterium]
MTDLSALLAPGRTRVVGILNVTPDSFSDGGLYDRTETAVAHGLAMVAEGADVVDVGGESTRPGALRVSADVERARVIPVVTALAAEGVAVSVDTMRADVALAAVQAGAVMVNDVSGGLADEEMLTTVAGLDVAYVAMHWRAQSDRMQQLAVYGDVVAEVAAELSHRAEVALAAGIRPDRLVLDPGLGFSKNADHNWALLRAVDTFESLGFPVMWGASRKSFLATVGGGLTRQPQERDAATVALTSILAAAGVWGVRVHTVAANVEAVAAAATMRGAS